MGQLCNEWFGDTFYYNIHVPLNLENIHGSDYFLYLGQDEISSDLGFIKGKVDSILSDTDVTVQVRTVHFFKIFEHRSLHFQSKTKNICTCASVCTCTHTIIRVELSVQSLSISSCFPVL